MSYRMGNEPQERLFKPEEGYKNMDGGKSLSIDPMTERSSWKKGSHLQDSWRKGVTSFIMVSITFQQT